MLKVYHPDYARYAALQTTCRDLSEGQDYIKSKGELYLPATSGMNLDGMSTSDLGYKNYQAYLKRAILPGYFIDGINTRMGLLYSKPPVIELPAGLEYLRNDCDGNGTKLETFMRYISYEQIIVGRLGIAADVVNERIALKMYWGERIINWGENFVILDESSEVVDSNFQWKLSEKFHLLTLAAEGGMYGTRTEKDGVLTELVFPSLKGKMLPKIPFIFINSTDSSQIPDKPPLVNLADMVLSIYRSEADYRNNLHMQGQDTLVIKGPIMGNTKLPQGMGEDVVRTGAGSRITVSPEGDAKYIGVNSSGLAEQRLALESDKQRAEGKAGELANVSVKGVESNDTLLTRISSRTVTLNEIALTGSESLSNLLKIVAEWSMFDPSAVSVTPNLDFTKSLVTGADANQIMDAKLKGAPLSNATIHQYFARGGVTNMEFQAEMELIAQEKANG